NAAGEKKTAVQENMYAPQFEEELQSVHPVAPVTTPAPAVADAEPGRFTSQVLTREEAGRAIAGEVKPKFTSKQQFLVTYAPTTHPNGKIAFGDYFRRIRESQNYSVEQISHQTCIQSRYINALEQEDFGKLPPPVYVISYIRKFGDLYKIAPEFIDNMVAELKLQQSFDVHDLAVATLEADEDANNNENREQDSKRLLLIIGLVSGVAILILGLIIWLVVALVNGKPDTGTQQNNRPDDSAAQMVAEPISFDSNKILELLPGAEFSTPELPVSQ
ncbi:MAG: helix-turn-helix transcriptional regulator, partial [Victivallaceae bacterium]